MRVLGREQDIVIELGGYRMQPIAQRDEINDVLIRVERTIDFDGYAVVVPMKAFADAVEGDEMRGAKDMLRFGDPHMEFFTHGLPFQRLGRVATS